MHTFIELTRAKPTWLALSEQERGAFLERVGGAMAALDAAGAEVLGWGTADETIDRDAGYLFFAVWRLPSDAEARLFAETLAEAGWYEYFEQVNVTGELRSPDEVMKDMVRL